VRVLASVEEDQLSRVRPDHRTIPVYRGYARGVAVVPDYEFPAGARWMIRAEEDAGHRIRVYVTLKSHPGSALNVQDHAVPVIGGRPDAFGTGSPGQFEKKAPVEIV
jgi:hypothetical protein